MNKAEHLKLIYSGKYSLPLDTATKRSYKIIVYRSTVISCKIDEILLPELPENYFILSSDDLKGKNYLKINGQKIPILANKYVNYIGEPILLLLGMNISILKSIYKEIKITYSDHEKEDEEIFFSKQVIMGLGNDAFINPYKTVSGSTKTPNSIIKSKYQHGSFTKREADSFTIYSSSIWENPLRDNIASICDVDPGKIKIITPTITGEDEYPLFDSYRSAAFTTFSSNIIKKNVSYVPTPEDQYLYSSKTYGIEAKWQIAFDKENSVIGIKIDVTLNSGAYPIFVKEKVLRIIHGLTSYYKFRNIIIDVKAIKSNSPPGGLSKSLYLSDALFVSELIISKIAKKSKLDQYTYRDANLLKQGYKNSSGTIIKQEIPLDIMLKNVVTQSDFRRKNSSINLALKNNTTVIHHSAKRGIGISIGYSGNGFISNEKEISTHSVTVQLNRDGKADLNLSCRINNLEILTIWENILSEILDIKPQDVTIYTGDSTLLEDSGPNIENKNISILTPMIKQCCEEIKDRRFKDPLPIKQTKMTRRKSSIVWNNETWKGIPFKNNSFAACAVEVEIDKRSLTCIIKEIWLQIEVGHILHKQSLLSSIKREIISTIKWLQEVEPKQREGEFATHYYYNGPIVEPNPEIHITFYETGKNKNMPKGIGALVRNTLPGAYIQGINLAIGSNINTFPISKEMIYRELKQDEL